MIACVPACDVQSICCASSSQQLTVMHMHASSTQGPGVADQLLDGTGYALLLTQGPEPRTAATLDVYGTVRLMKSWSNCRIAMTTLMMRRRREEEEEVMAVVVLEEEGLAPCLEVTPASGSSGSGRWQCAGDRYLG